MMAAVPAWASNSLLSSEIDALLLRARGLVLVRGILAERGASEAELESHESELERVRARLADLVNRAASEAI